MVMHGRSMKRFARFVAVALAAAAALVASDAGVRSADPVEAQANAVAVTGEYECAPWDPWIRLEARENEDGSTTQVYICDDAPPVAAVAAGSMTEIAGEPNGIAVLSVGVTNNRSRGYIQVLDCNETAGAYSNLNADRVDQTIASLVITKLDADGKACVYNHMTTDLFVDLQGYLDPSAFTPDARRLKDTRTTPTTPPIAAGGRTKFVGKPNGIAVLSIVGTQSLRRGYLQVVPCAISSGEWSNLNLERSGQTIANMAIIELDNNGEACVYTHGGAHIVVDLQGYLDAATFAPDFGRKLDTRGAPTPAPGSKTAVTAGSSDQLAVMSLVATETLARGYVQALPCNQANGAWSNLNTDRPNQTIANLAIVPLDAAGETCLYTHGGAHLIADVQGYLDPTVFTTVNKRILDTRND